MDQQNALSAGVQAEIMPPAPEAATLSGDDMGISPALLNDPNDDIRATSGELSESDANNVEMRLVTRGIYQCQDGNRSVFVDEENRVKYRQCTQIRAPYYEQVITNNPAESERSPCSGAIVYKGSTYVFNDQEPCPILEEIFEARKPIEANPEYYSQPTS
ncbi:hypothetical protein KRX19_02795 [Cardiobacteriaceae bacterium TAE3-ERU3]|nr:hypothetical protein [Cardiobacteriaceae bacterium TAE3-ERU3]